MIHPNLPSQVIYDNFWTKRDRDKILLINNKPQGLNKDNIIQIEPFINVQDTSAGLFASGATNFFKCGLHPSQILAMLLKFTYKAFPDLSHIIQSLLSF